MSHNKTNPYDLSPAVADWYDSVENGTDDIEQIRRLLGKRRGLSILEPFCGTGRILIPLALDGHEMVGLDQSSVMLSKAKLKSSQLPEDVQGRITLIQADVTSGGWPVGFDVVILGGNFFYELATPQEQEGCLASAAAALKTGGFLYCDSDHMEGELAEAWRISPETIWCDVPARLWRGRRTSTITDSQGTTTSWEWIQQKHPVSAWEVRDWIVKHGFRIEKHFGGHEDVPYNDALPRTTFWARKM